MSKKKRKFKLFSNISDFFKKIYKFIDKVVITPIAKLVLKIGDFFKNNNKFLGTLLNNKVVLITISLVLAFVIFFIVDNQNNIYINQSADVLYSQKVEALYNEEAYTVEGIPETADITIIGRKADLYLAKQFASTNITVDLSGLKPGTHKVSLKYSKAVSSVEYKIDPSTINVTIYEKVSESRTISTDVLHQDSLDSRYQIKNVSLNRNEVYIKGAEHTLEKVAVVKALVDIKEITNPSVGTTSVKSVPLVAYDAKGEKLDVEIVPSTIDATVQIESPKKEVPLKVIPEGEVVFGKAIDSLTTNIKTVTIYGNKDILDDITYIPVKVNVSNLSSQTSVNVTLSKPDGVKEMSATSATVKVTLARSTDSEIEHVGIIPKNLASGYIANTLSEEDSNVTITVKGTANAIKSLDKETVIAYVDLSGLKEGTHEVDVLVTGEDLRLSYTSKTKKVKIVIQKAK